jgi:hypothetical protein
MVYTCEQVINNVINRENSPETKTPDVSMCRPLKTKDGKTSGLLDIPSQVSRKADISQCRAARIKPLQKFKLSRMGERRNVAAFAQNKLEVFQVSKSTKEGHRQPI